MHRRVIQSSKLNVASGNTHIHGSLPIMKYTFQLHASHIVYSKLIANVQCLCQIYILFVFNFSAILNPFSIATILSVFHAPSSISSYNSNIWMNIRTRVLYYLLHARIKNSNCFEYTHIISKIGFRTCIPSPTDKNNPSPNLSWKIL